VSVLHAIAAARRAQQEHEQRHDVQLSLRPRCEQACGAEATVYAIDRCPGGWGGRYCEPCAQALGFNVIDRLDEVLS
jgi:hypothetical protein